ncbi:MAG: 1-acyl-sn-glycerol-3-phosphate acyltransferase [Acidobacteria bacterium]|nr:1-acyl-sn-glycerol-3-phosphate acyltransferase [Acidobacteriota bacterium]
MRSRVKRLGLKDLIFGREGSFAVRVLGAIFGIGLTVFFRRIELFNHEKLPQGSGLIFVSNHPNALIDPALLFVALPRRIAFLAKSTLFKMPVIGWLVKTVGALPLYRQQDRGEDVSKNQETFTLARELLKSGGAIALFPEGVSHNSPQLLPLKTGAARIALGAVSSGTNPESLVLEIVPVGLYYTSKTTFRSEALLHFGTPFRVARVELDENGHPPRESVRELNESIERALREVTLNAESDARLEVAKIAEEVFTVTTPHREHLGERLQFLQKFVAETRNEDDLKLEKRLEEYNRKLDELGIESEFLDLAEYSRRFVIKHAILRSWYLVLLAPLAIFGTILHFVPYRLGRIISATQTRKGDHDMTSTVKLLTAMVFMPLTWLGFAVVVDYFFGWMYALLSIPFSFLSGWVALRSIEEIEELRGWLKAILVFFGKREKFLRLLAERRSLFEKVSK